MNGAMIISKYIQTGYGGIRFLSLLGRGILNSKCWTHSTEALFVLLVHSFETQDVLDLPTREKAYGNDSLWHLVQIYTVCASVDKNQVLLLYENRFLWGRKTKTEVRKFQMLSSEMEMLHVQFLCSNVVVPELNLFGMFRNNFPYFQISGEFMFLIWSCTHAVKVCPWLLVIGKLGICYLHDCTYTYCS